MDPPANTTSLGPFELLSPLAEGGMGSVWLGQHRVQGVEVAVKVLTAKGARDPRFLSAFDNEVRTVAALDHPTVVRIFDFQ